MKKLWMLGSSGRSAVAETTLYRPEAVRRALAEHLRAKGYLKGEMP